jgi:hypothetical protein
MMTAPVWPPMPLRDGAVGENDASPPQAITKTEEITRSKPPSGVLFIETSGKEELSDQGSYQRPGSRR